MTMGSGSPSAAARLRLDKAGFRFPSHEVRGSGFGHPGKDDVMKVVIAMAALAAVLAGGDAQAAEHEVRMLNKGEKGAMVFEPDFLRAGPGDTVRFVAVDKGHNAESIKGMLPDGVEGFKSKINEEVVFTVTADGVYGIKCTPHYSMGMVMLILVGEPANLEAASKVKHPGKAKALFEELLSAVAAR
jgi:pseudoazurin